MRAFNATVGCVDAARGATAWTRPANGTEGLGGDDRQVFGTEADGKVVAWARANGQPAWTSELLLRRGPTAPLLLGRSVAIGDNTGLVHLLSRENGQLSNRLSTDGSPIVAVTPGATPSSWLPATDAPTGATRLEALATPAVEWQERCRVADGDLDVDGVTFALHDLPGLTGLAEGQPWLTYLTTRPADDVPRAVLAASFTAADTTFTLSDYGLIASSFPCVLWIDDEAINCASILAGVVTVASGGRGYYGTRARAHTIDEELGVIPEAWAAPVWLQRRRVLRLHAHAQITREHPGAVRRCGRPRAPARRRPRGGPSAPAGPRVA